jgi:Domain of unknown function (DUF1707)
MTAEPYDEMAAAAADRGHLRASHADREHVIDTVKAAFVQGRLTKDELDLRVGQVLAARTYADLAALTADLPAGLIGAQPPGETVPAQAQPTVNKALLWSSWAVLLLIIGFMGGAFPTVFLGLLAVGALPLLIVAPLAVALTLDSCRQKRSRGRLPGAT